MAAPYNPPKKGEDFLTYISLLDMASTGDGSVRFNPTLSSADFKVSKDGGAFAALTSTPTVEPSTGPTVRLWLSSAEMAADTVVVYAIDATVPKEWADHVVSIITASSA